jgi:hypothetical protein
MCVINRAGESAIRREIQRAFAGDGVLRNFFENFRQLHLWPPIPKQSGTA